MLLTINDLVLVIKKRQSEGNIFTRLFRDRHESQTLLDQVNLSVEHNEYLGLVGESGSGKSLTVKSLLGMIDFTPGVVKGKIEYYNESNRQRLSILNTEQNNLRYFDFLSLRYTTSWHLPIADGKLTLPHCFVKDWEQTRLVLYKTGYPDDYELITEPKKLFDGNNHLLFRDTKYNTALLHGKAAAGIKTNRYLNRIRKTVSREKLPGKHISIILQDPISFLNPFWSMKRQIRNLLSLHQNTVKTEDVLSYVKLNNSNFLNAIPRELSGGQGQRAMIILASLTQPKLLIADEPTTGLDTTMKKLVVSKFKGLRDSLDGTMAMIFISHDINMVRKATDRINVMYEGKIIENGKSSEFMNIYGHHPYTSRLLDITHANFVGESAGIEDAGVSENQGGCRYYKYCPEKIRGDKCKYMSPPAINIKNGAVVDENDIQVSWAKCWMINKIK